MRQTHLQLFDCEMEGRREGGRHGVDRVDNADVAQSFTTEILLSHCAPAIAAKEQAHTVVISG
jgi:hypothetical protein